MNEVKMIFLKKECEVEMYNKIKKRLIKNGYKPLNNITYNYYFDCKQTKQSYKSPTEHKYPYTITLKCSTGVEHYKLAA